MIRSLKIHYSVVAIALIFLLPACELARDSGEAGDTSPLAAMPPTLAPLGAEDSALAGEATAVPTVLSVQPTATASTLESEAPASAIELVAPTAQPPSVPAEPVAENNAAEEAPAAESSAAPVAEPTTAPAIITDATTPEELPDGGPIAANPPPSETSPIIPAASSGGAYTVQAGDTLFSISQRYGTTVEAIVAANGLNSDLVQIGQTLTIPAADEAYAPPAYEPGAPAGPGGTYVVGPDDTLFRIAMRFGTTVEALASANNIPYPFIIHAGQTLIIPSAEGAYPAPGYAPEPGYYPQPPADGYYQQPGPGYYPQQPPPDGYYPQPGPGYYPQQPPSEGYYPPDQGYYPQQPPADGYYQQPEPGYYPQQPPSEGYYPPDQGYYPQQPPNGYYQQPSQDEGYYPAPGYGAPPVPGGANTHTVAPGETLYSIARRYGVPAEAIAAANGLANPNQIFVGQVLYLP